jgi:hypothetical protein
LEMAEKSRLFGEFKCFTHLRQKFRNEFLVKEYEEYKSDLEYNPFRPNTTPTIIEFWVSNKKQLHSDFIQEVSEDFASPKFVK